MDQQKLLSHISIACRQTVELFEKFCAEQNHELILLAKRLGTLFAEGGQLLLAGNGSLQLVAQQLASQFSFRLSFDRPVLPAICLGSDPVLNARMIASGEFEQHLVRHYRALNAQQYLLLLLNDGSSAVSLVNLRDEAVEDEQTVVLISSDCQNDPLRSADVKTCLNLATESVPRQIEVTQFVGHLLCELVEAELFER